MTLARTALRLAVIEALAPHALNGVPNATWPTFADDRVRDSIIELDAEAYDEDGPACPGPRIAVFADEAKTEPLGTAQDVLFAGDGRERVTLAFEIMVPAVIRQNDQRFVIPAAGTDAMAEGFLDMIEEQIRQRIADGRMNGPLRLVLDRVDEVSSNPWRDADLDQRLSARRVEFDCIVRQGGLWPAPDKTGLEALPSPLREVALELHEASYGRKVCDSIAAAIGDRAVFAALAEIRLAARLQRSEGDAPAPPPDASKTPPEGDVTGSISL
jgi:hypothetical protein